jgi:hypothetical protein
MSKLGGLRMDQRELNIGTSSSARKGAAICGRRKGKACDAGDLGEEKAG